MVTALADAAPAVAAPGIAPKPPRRRELSPREIARRGKVIAALHAPAVIAEDEALLERSYYGIADAFRPRNRWQEWASARIATLMIRIDRSERVERKLRDWAAYRAFDFWEDDQQLVVEELAAKLARNPAKVAAQLRLTPAGLDWLAARWRSLARLAPDAWCDEHRELAARLLGGDDFVDPTAPGFAAARIDELEACRSRVEEADAVLRGLVESDLSDGHVPDLAKLRRQSREWQRQMKWLVDQFHVDHADRWDDPMRRPAHEKATPDGFREVDYNHFEGPRPLEPLTPPAPPVAEAEPITTRDETKRPAPATTLVADVNPIPAEPRRVSDETKRPARPLAGEAQARVAVAVGRPGDRERSQPAGGRPSDADRLRRARRRATLASF